MGKMRGEFNHTIDAKGRLFFPAKLRDKLGESFIVTKGIDGCLFVYSTAAWDELESRIAAMPMSKSREMQRFFFSSAADCEADAQGRILIPQTLREHAGITREVTVIGVSGRAEIWDTARWNAYNSRIDESALIEAMEELGF